MKNYILIVLLSLIFIGCAGSLSSENEKKMSMTKVSEMISLMESKRNKTNDISIEQLQEKVKKQFLKEKKENNWAYDINSPEFVAYAHVYHSVFREYKGSLAYVDDELKKSMAESLYNPFKIAYKYKFFEPSYELFGDYLTLDEIKKLSSDEIILPYTISEIGRNYLIPVAGKFNIEVLKSMENEKNIRIGINVYLPMADEWVQDKEDLVLKNYNGIWKVTKSKMIDKLKDLIEKEISYCINKDNKETKNYKIKIKRIYTETCKSLKKTGNNNVLGNSILNNMTVSKAEFQRNLAFGTNNGNCMNLFKKSDYPDIDKLIVPISECEKLNIDVTVPSKTSAPSFQAMQNFYFNGGKLICKKENDKDKTVVSKTTGWTDWQPTKEIINTKDTTQRFKISECSDYIMEK